MKPLVHSYYTILSIKREIASERKIGKLDNQEEEPRHWMNNPSCGVKIRKVEGEHGDRERLARRRSHIPIWEETLERKFNKLIITITNMTKAIMLMQK